jgi:hypothetical protein
LLFRNERNADPRKISFILSRKSLPRSAERKKYEAPNNPSGVQNKNYNPIFSSNFFLKYIKKTENIKNKMLKMVFLLNYFS